MIFFENTLCVACGAALGFLPEIGRLESLTPLDGGAWDCPRFPGRYRRCQHEICNWLIPDSDPRPFCRSCRLNRTLPDLSVPLNHQRWVSLETAKRRWLYGALALGLPCLDREEDSLEGLAFDFLAPEAGPVMTGHENGIITVNASEADDATRERARLNLNESYRTLLGHFRHESGHYYWNRLIVGTDWLDGFRDLFGNEQADYAEALRRHHQDGPPADWLERGYISAYASSHPWEDWAETWAHYMHIMDTLETAQSFGLKAHRLDVQAGGDTGFEAVLKDWVPLTLALNSLNRSMGLQDLYPFVLSRQAIAKLSMVHEVVSALGRPRWPDSVELLHQL